MGHKRQVLGFILAGLMGVQLVLGAEGEEGHGKEENRAGHAHHEHAQHRSVRLSAEQRSRLDLRIGQVEAGSAQGVLQLPATVRFDRDRVAKIGPRLRAKVVRVTKDLGAWVQAGETVAVMDSVALGKAKAGYLTAQAAFETARADYRREQQLAEKQISSQAELLDARARFREARAQRDAAAAELRLYGLSQQQIQGIEAGGEKPLSRYRLTSPRGGVIQKRALSPGQTLHPEETPIHVVDTAQVWVMLEGYERHLPVLQTGQPVELELRALPNRTFTGTIDWISRNLDQRTRTVRVRAVIKNPEGLLRAGMFGEASVRTKEGDRVAMIPVDAVQTLHKRPVVFVPGAEEGHFRVVSVTLGQEAGKRVEVLTGVKPGDRLVVRGAFDLKSALTAGGRSATHSH